MATLHVWLIINMKNCITLHTVGNSRCAANRHFEGKEREGGKSARNRTKRDVKFSHISRPRRSVYKNGWAHFLRVSNRNRSALLKHLSTNLNYSKRTWKGTMAGRTSSRGDENYSCVENHLAFLHTLVTSSRNQSMALCGLGKRGLNARSFSLSRRN